MQNFDTNADFNLNIDHFAPPIFDPNYDFNPRYIKPPLSKIPSQIIKYDNAERLAKDITIEKGCRYFTIIKGTFIFGDFIEALIVENNWSVERLSISTLSMSENNVDSLRNLIDGGFVEKLDLIVSDHFFSHERHNLVPYIYEQLDIEDKFQFAVCGSHCKIGLISTKCGKKIIMDGSANLRSSGNIEQFRIEEDENLHDFNLENNDNVIERFNTINKNIPKKNLWKTKTVRYNQLWDVINNNQNGG